MRIRTLKLSDTQFGTQWFDEVADHWDYNDFRRNPAWRNGWISFDCALHEPRADRIYLGITSFGADIFKAYDRGTDRFADLGFARIADPFDAKFHRALCFGPDGCVYGAIALLHDVDRYFEAPGGAIVRYNPGTGGIAKIGVPLPHVYIQSMVLDGVRGVAYCLCFAPEKLAVFNLRTGESRDLGLLGTYGGMAQGENLILDDAGCVWTSWTLTRAWASERGPDADRLCKYDPQLGHIVFYRHGLPKPDGSYGFAKLEGLFNFGDGFVYASGANGSFYRIAPDKGLAEYLFTPTPDRRSRLSSLVKAEDGVAYGVTGRDGQCELLRVFYRRGTFEKLGPIEDADGAALWQNHDIVRTSNGTLYICENDNPYRSSYLWEVRL